MRTRRVKCPSCGGLLSLPGEVRGLLVRCGLCRRTFRLPKSTQVPEDTIFGWLHQPPEEEDKRAGTLAPLTGEANGASEVAGQEVGSLHLVSLERDGALFEFPAEFLNKEVFRCAIPRVCLHCLGQTHLSVHAIIFAPQLRDSISLEADGKMGGPPLSRDMLGDLHGPELLDRMPKIPNVPAPADLPMPFWVCDLCSGAREISGQIQVNPETGKGTCRLYFHNLQVAAGFFAGVSGTKNEDYARFVELFQHMREDRWDAMPLVVRHRLEQWFKPIGKERFLAYIPDRTRAWTEDGMAGLAISNERLVYHRPPLHQEISANFPVTIQVRSFEERRKIATISGANFKTRSITLDRKGEMALHGALGEGNFNAIWR